MRWQYRTILFEFGKDGLLGDKYLDDEEVEKTLNQQGNDEWELVNVTMMQEGLLAVLKRPRRSDNPLLSEQDEPANIISTKQDTFPKKELTVQAIQQEEQEHIRELEQQRRQTMEKRERDLIGDIKIL